MEITETRITLSKETNRLKAYANIVIDGGFIVRGLKVIDGGNGMFVAMPSGKRGDIAHPINNETRLFIENTVLDAYEDELNGGNSKPNVEFGRKV